MSRSVAIIALGKSAMSYWGDFRKNGYQRFTDQVWTINHGGYIFKDIDMVVAMDDVEWKEREYGNYIPHLMSQGIPVLTANTSDRYSNIIKYPLREVWDNLDVGRMLPNFSINNSTVYAILYAAYKGYTTLYLYGFDFRVRREITKINYDDPYWRPHHLPENLPLYGEPGEDLVMYVLGYLTGQGKITCVLPNTTTLFNMDIPDYFYGYYEKPAELLGK